MKKNVIYNNCEIVKMEGIGDITSIFFNCNGKYKMVRCICDDFEFNMIHKIMNDDILIKIEERFDDHVLSVHGIDFALRR